MAKCKHDPGYLNCVLWITRDRNPQTFFTATSCHTAGLYSDAEGAVGCTVDVFFPAVELKVLTFS